MIKIIKTRNSRDRCQKNPWFVQDNWISSMKGRHSLQKYLRCKWKGKTSRAIEISKFRGKIIPRRCKPIFEYRRQQDGRNSSGNNSSQSFIDDTIVACNSLNGRLSHWRSRARARTSVRSPRVGEWQKNIFSNSLTNLDLRTDVSPEPWRSGRLPAGSGCDVIADRLKQPWKGKHGGFGWWSGHNGAFITTYGFSSVKIET